MTGRTSGLSDLAGQGLDLLSARMSAV
jgi:hypothetical protein